MTEKLGLGKELGQRTGGVMVAEGAGIVTSLGSLMLVKKLAGPERMAAAREHVAMDIMLPILKRMEAVSGKFGKKDKATINPAAPEAGKDSATEMMEKASEASGATAGKATIRKAADVFKAEGMTLEDKAHQYAETFLDMAIMAPVGIVTRILTQDHADRMFGAPKLDMKHYVYAKVPDMVANNTALVAMNTVAKAPTQAVSRTVEKLLGGLGVEPTSAKSMATYLTYVQGSNFVGNVANVGYVTAMSRKQQGMTPPSEPAR